MPKSLFLIAEACNFIKKETLAQVFPVNFTKYLGRPFSIEKFWMSGFLLTVKALLYDSVVFRTLSDT